MVLQSKALRSLVGSIKDKASLSKATFFSSSAGTSPTSPDLVVLRATTHSADPPSAKHITALLSFGRGSRLAAAAAITALTSRLQSTHDPAVALKCLVSFHFVIHHGSFILHDQLVSALRPTSGGRNHLNLSGRFRRRSGNDPEAWEQSSWVRWYARVLELLVSACRELGAFPRRRVLNERPEQEKVVSLLNGDLLRELDSLVGVMEEIHRAPHRGDTNSNNRLVEEVVRLVGDDRVAVVDEVLVRVMEIGERMRETIGFGEGVELACLLRRLEECKKEGGKMWITSSDWDPKEDSRFWRVVADVKEKAAGAGAAAEGKRVSRGERVGESARIGGGDRDLLSSGERIRFGSYRWPPLTR